MTTCATCGIPIDLSGEDYSAHWKAGAVPYYTCGGCSEPETESTANVTIVTVSENDLMEG